MRLALLLLATLLHAGEWTPVEVIATAYCPCARCCGERAVGLTADGTDVRSWPYGVAKAIEAAQQQERAERKREADRKRLDDYRTRQRGSGDDTPDVAATKRVSSEVNITGQNKTGQNKTGQDSITPPPSPASAGAPPAAAAAGLRAKVRGYDPARVLVACTAGDLLALVAAFGGNIDRGDEWARDSAGQRIGTIAAVLDWRMVGGQPIREPSGLRAAISEWTAQPLAWRKAYAHDFAKAIGLPVLSPGAERAAGGPT